MVLLNCFLTMLILYPYTDFSTGESLCIYGLNGLIEYLSKCTTPAATVAGLVLRKNSYILKSMLPQLIFILGIPPVYIPGGPI